MNRLVWLGWGTLVCVLALAGCPGSLDNPERFGGGNCRLDVEADILAPSCAIDLCHNSTTRATGLDLSGANVGSRLVGVPAATAADEPDGMCEGMGPIIDGANPSNSLLLDKVSRAPRCGIPMPFGSMGLTDDEIACIRQYVMDAAETGGGADAGGGGDTDAGMAAADGG